MNKNIIIFSGLTSILTILSTALPALAQIDYTYSTSGTTDADTAAGILGGVTLLVSCISCLIAIAWFAFAFIWVRKDATARNNTNAMVWAIFSGLFWPVLLVYVFTQRKSPVSQVTPEAEVPVSE